MSYQKNYPNGWQSGEAGGTPITPETLNNMEDGIANSLPKDGTDPMSANLPMGGNRVTGLGNPVEDGDAVPLGYAGQHFAPAQESADYPGCYYRTVNGAIEWLNPPMVLGVEYRTTRWHNGKPIYTKALDIGTMPNATSKTIAHGIADVGVTFPVKGCMTTSTNVVSIPYFNSTTNFVGITMQQANVVVVTGGNSSQFSGIIHLEYTKATD